MTTDMLRGLVEELTKSFAAIEGVRSIFPERQSGAVTLRLVGADPPASRRVQIDAGDGPMVITARLATERAVPTRAVVAAAVTAAAQVVGPAQYELHLEIASVD